MSSVAIGLREWTLHHSANSRNHLNIFGIVRKSWKFFSETRIKCIRKFHSFDSGKESSFQLCYSPFRNEKGILLQKKFDPRLFIGSLLGSRQSAIGQSFSLSLVTIPELFAKVPSAEFQDPGLRLTDQSMAWSDTRALSIILFFLHKPVRYKHYIRYLRPLVFKTRTTTSNAKQCARMNQRHFGGKTW